MKVILTENVSKVGKKYQVKEVAPGFGRNFLISRNLARLATDEEVARLEKEKAQHEAELAKKHDELMAQIEKAGEFKLEMTAKANEHGHLYAGLDVIDIVLAYKKEHNVDLNPDLIMLEAPIKSVGEYEVKIKKNAGAQNDEAQFATLKIEVIGQ